jgi:enterochelin esterase-like enzyme
VADQRLEVPGDAGQVSRRTLLLAAGAVVVGAVGTTASPRVRTRLQALVPWYDEPDLSPEGPTGPAARGTFDSRQMRRGIGWSIGYPVGSSADDRMPLFLVLHGRGSDHRAVLGSHRIGAFLSDVVRAGTKPFAVVGVDGGDHSYWHRRASGEDPQAMILDELLPILASRGLRTDRFALGGWSMGGYGALLLAERLGPSRVVACAVDGPALWTRAKDTASGAFDGRADFEAHDVVGQHARLAGIPVRIACGTSDPFLPGVEALLAAVPDAARDLRAGGHTPAFWRSGTPAQLTFVGQHLAAS